MSLLCATLTSEKYLEHPNKGYLAFSQMAFVGRPGFRRRSVTANGRLLSFSKGAFGQMQPL